MNTEQKKIKIDKACIQKIIFFILIAIGIAIRLIGWPNQINDIECDEAMTALNAKSIADSGKDIYDTSFPVYFRAWNHAEQSAMLTYLMAISIKILGFTKVAIRLPSLICSIISMFVIYDLVLRNSKNRRWALFALGLVIISPWNYYQSIWSLDCNLMSHFFLWAIYFLTRVQEKKRYLYISMLLFGLTMYTYGVALFSIPVFLVIAATYLYCKKIVNWKEILICVLIFLAISLPIFTMGIINVLKLPTIKVGPITIEYFENSQRKADTLIFTKNQFKQFKINIVFLLSLIFYQRDCGEFVGISTYGTIYFISVIFLVITLFDLAISWIRNLKREINESKQGKKATPPEMTSNKLLIDMTLMWLLGAFIQGILINEVTILRMNMIFYAIIILVAYGIDDILKTIEENKKALGIICEIAIIIIYSITSMFFFRDSKYYIENEMDTLLLDQGYTKALEFAINELNRTDNIVIINVKRDEKIPVYSFYAKEYCKQKYNVDLKMYDLENPDKLEDGSIYIFSILSRSEKLSEYIKDLDSNDKYYKKDKYFIIEKNY